MPKKQASETQITEATNAVEFTLRVRYAETDQMQRVHHAVYLVWFEAARAEYCRANGIDYTQMEADGLFLPVYEARCRYLAPARYDDEITVRIFVLELRRATLRAGYHVYCGDTRLAEGETVSVLVNREGKPVAFPKDLAARFAGKSFQQD